MARTRLHVWNEGDPSVGIQGSSAIVELNSADDSDLTRHALARAFEDIWDFDIHVASEDELRAEEERAQAERDRGYTALGCGWEMRVLTKVGP